MLRLTRTQERPHEIVLKAEGQMVAEWVGLLERECLELASAKRRVLLDLGDVSYLDRRAVEVLRHLTSGGVTIVNCSPLVEELLAEDPA
jgi:anti-anti-sigma regulatory factor